MKSKTTITFFGSVNEIGGNKILIRDKDTQVFLDFGLPFSQQAEYFAGYLFPRAVNGAGDYLEFGLLPKMKGLYSRDAIKSTKIKYSEPEVDGIILSHAHLDHVGYLPFIDKTIPVHCGEGTKIIIEAMEDSSRIDLGEHDYRTFRTGQIIRIGSLEIEPIHVDHSIPAAYGFIIHTSKGSIAYSGDLRIHGPLNQMTWDFVDKARSSEIEFMISEGTRISPKKIHKGFSESKVKEKSNKVVANAPKLVIASFYSRDVDRFRTFYEISKKNNRKFVISIKLAHFLTKLRKDPRLQIPDVIKDETILFYKKRKKSGDFLLKDYYIWERPFLDKAKTFDYVKRNQSNVIFNLDLVGFTELIDVKPHAGGDFIHSMSEPFSEEDINSKVLHKWLSHFNLKFHQIHASGHCPSHDLIKIIDEIQPKKLTPIHTEHPVLFKRLLDAHKHHVKLAEEGKKIQL